MCKLREIHLIKASTYSRDVQKWCAACSAINKRLTVKKNEKAFFIQNSLLLSCRSAIKF